MSGKPYINVHTHIFTDKHIPNHLAKKFIPWPFYYLMPVRLIFVVFKAYKNFKRNIWSGIIAFQIKLISLVQTNLFTKYLGRLISLIFTWNLLVFILELSKPSAEGTLGQILNWIQSSPLSSLLIYKLSAAVIWGIIVFLILLYPNIIKFIWQLAKKIVSPLQYVPSSTTLQFIQRYLTIAEFTKYKNQSDIFDRMVKMYPAGTKFVVLPMDMQFMKAGSLKENYIQQLTKIEEKKATNRLYHDQLIPFLFVDPRRIAQDYRDPGQTKPFFAWQLAPTSKHFELKDCLFKDYFEGRNGEPGHFKGIKLYPALGYYPFDQNLLPIYYYCVKNDIPILTHCTKGTIFYRGFMKKVWMKHPIFKDSNGNLLATHAKSNFDLQVNWTHPLNYLVLLEDHFFMDLLDQCDQEVQDLFGYDSAQRTIQHSLRNLKINLAHYGGAEEWSKYLEADRSDASAELMENPDRGLEMVITQSTGKFTKPAYLWENDEEWFTIISSLMLQYPGIYADISYVLHEATIMPILKYFLDTNPKLARKILFGTDFFVVRNHKSEKELLSETIEQIGLNNFEIIAKQNPKRYLDSDFLSI